MSVLSLRCKFEANVLSIRSRDENGIEIGPGVIGPAALGDVIEGGSLAKNTVADENPNRYRLERSGSVSWEAPGAVLHGT